MDIDALLDSAEQILNIKPKAEENNSVANYSPDLSSGSIYDDIDEALSNLDLDSASPAIDINSSAVSDFLSSLDEDADAILKTIHNSPQLKIEIKTNESSTQLVQTTNENSLKINSDFSVDEFLEFAQSQVAKASSSEESNEELSLENKADEASNSSPISKLSLVDQYQNIKSENQDAIVFFKVGDFYEVLLDDAATISAAIGLTLTSRQNNGTSVPMSGFMVSNLDSVISGLSTLQRRILICEKSPDIAADNVYKIVNEFKAPELNEESTQEDLQDQSGVETTNEIDSQEIEKNELNLLAEKIRTEPKPENLIELNDSVIFQSTSGITLDKFPKAMVKENTNRTKRLDWFELQLSKQEDEASKSVSLLISKYKDIAECYSEIETVALHALFGNGYGPTPVHKLPTKEELAAAKEAEKLQRHQQMVQAALEKAADTETIQRNLAELARAENIITGVLSASAKSQVVEKFNEALTKSANSVITQSAEDALDIRSKSNDPILQKRPVEVSATQEIEPINSEIEQEDKPSFYAIYKEGKVIATGEADKFPLKLLQQMADQTDGVLMWSRKPFDIVKATTVVQQISQPTIDNIGSSEHVSPDKFQSEIQKGLKLVSNSGAIPIHDQRPKPVEKPKIEKVEEPLKIEQQTESPGDSLKKKLNSAVTTQLGKIIDSNSKLQRPHDVHFYASTTNDNNVLVSIKNETEKMIFGCITPQGKFTQLKDFTRKNLGEFIISNKIVEISFDGAKDEENADSSISPSL